MKVYGDTFKYQEGLPTNMRLWSLHPMYLDKSGFLGCWREALLARAVLAGQTKGYKNHSQLVRFKSSPEPWGGINMYLYGLWDESRARGYHFDSTKFSCENWERIPVTIGQVEYERQHLIAKIRDRIKRKISEPEELTYGLIEGPLAVHPLFYVVEGGIEGWEKIKTLLESRPRKPRRAKE